MPVGTKKQVEINGDIIMAVITVLEMTNKGYKGVLSHCSKIWLRPKVAPH